jgi:GxxExxY protein
MLTDPCGRNALTRAIIGCAIDVHREIGPGVLENVYNECLQAELRRHRLKFDLERQVPLTYKGERLKAHYYVDMVVESLVVVELKAVAEIAEIHKRQLLTQLRLTGLTVGLILNFNVKTLTEGGVKRIVNRGRSADMAGSEVEQCDGERA